MAMDSLRWWPSERGASAVASGASEKSWSWTGAALLRRKVGPAERRRPWRAETRRASCVRASRLPGAGSRQSPGKHRADAAMCSIFRATSPLDVDRAQAARRRRNAAQRGVRQCAADCNPQTWKGRSGPRDEAQVERPSDAVERLRRTATASRLPSSPGCPASASVFPSAATCRPRPSPTPGRPLRRSPCPRSARSPT